MSSTKYSVIGHRVHNVDGTEKVSGSCSIYF